MPNQVLVAIPYRANTPPMFRVNALNHFYNLSYAAKHLAFVENDILPEAQHYGAHARARNSLIKHHLKPGDDFVLWLDVDLVRVPHDLIERLLRLGHGQIAAPFVFVEKLNQGEPPSFSNGGWFYDTGGFVREGEPTSAYFPYWQGYEGGKIELDSVGCCCLVPAEIYHKGARYEPIGDEVEHRSLMRQAKAMGYHIYASDAIKVEHAYLPAYGQKWNHKGALGSKEAIA